MSEPTRAVFLSYAREDAEAAKRIAEALRAFGVEVWFDQNELRGGDTWDVNIRNQIKSCALFIPLVSVRTEERSEGYFRREWKLAVDRTHDMAGSRSFIVPVVIDETSESGAAVPEEFMRYQWTRLAGGQPSPEFVAQIKRLLDAPKKPALKTEHPKPPTLPPELKQVGASLDDARGRAQGAPLQKGGVPGWVWGAMVVLLVTVIAVIQLSRKPAPLAAVPVPQSPSLSPSLSPPPQATADAKSIAVLPFTNMSEDKDSGYFADGVHEDVLTNLAKIAQLKVIARTSVMEYRNTTKKIQQIAQELGVAYILEGSVRRAGNRVRVVCQLIDGRTGSHVLAPDPYDRDLADIFAIQSEIAQGIAAKLQAALAPSEKATLERTPTANLAAYDLCLKARAIMDSRIRDAKAQSEQARALLEIALQYDPKFSLAWYGLGYIHLNAYYRFDQTEGRRLLAKAAIEKARELDPHDARTLGLETNYYIDTRDLSRARELAAQLEREFPSQAITHHVLARLNRLDGRPQEALVNYRRAWNLDPRNSELGGALCNSLVRARKYAEAADVIQAASNIFGADQIPLGLLPMLSLRATGSLQELEAGARQLAPAAERGDVNAVSFMRSWASLRGDADEVIRYWEKHGEAVSDTLGRPQFTVAAALVLKGRRKEALAVLEKERDYFRPRIASRPDNINNWFYLAFSHALLGDKAGVDEVRRQMLAANPGLSDYAKGEFDEVRLLSWLGDKQGALDELERQLAKNGYFESVHVLRTTLVMRPLQGDPRFEALLNDPKNNAPLF